MAVVPSGVHTEDTRRHTSDSALGRGSWISTGTVRVWPRRSGGGGPMMLVASPSIACSRSSVAVSTTCSLARSVCSYSGSFSLMAATCMTMATVMPASTSMTRPTADSTEAT